MKTITFDETQWQLAPKEPIKEMWDAVEGMCTGVCGYENDNFYGDTSLMLPFYQKLLAAAPQPPVVCPDCNKPSGPAGQVHTCSPQINQCDGCRRGLPESIPGMHRDESGPMTCTKGRYVEPLKELSAEQLMSRVELYKEPNIISVCRAAIEADRKLNGRN